MTAHFASSVVDNGLASLKSAARYLYICTSEPTTYAEASSTYAKGVKDAGAGGICPNAIAASSINQIRQEKALLSLRPLMASGGSTPYTTAEAMGKGAQNRSLRRSLPQHRQLQS